MCNFTRFIKGLSKRRSLTQVSFKRGATARKVSKWGVFSGPYFPVFELDTENYGGNLRIQSEYKKIQARKNSVFGHFSCNVQSVKLVNTYRKPIMNKLEQWPWILLNIYFFIWSYVMRCAILYHLNNLKNVKNTQRRSPLSVTILHGCFSLF